MLGLYIDGKKLETFEMRNRKEACDDLLQTCLTSLTCLQVSSMKWESSSIRPPSVGGMSNKSKLCSPVSSGIQGHPSDLVST